MARQEALGAVVSEPVATRSGKRSLGRTPAAASFGGAAMRRYVRLGLLTAVAAVLLLIGGAAGASPGVTSRVSVKTDGSQANGNSTNPAIDPYGRCVVFESAASSLVDGDTNGAWDIFVRDRDTDDDGFFDEAGAVSTIRVSVKTDGTQANGSSYNAAISSTSRFVAFESDASNLVDGDGNGKRDIFVRDRDTDNDGIFDEEGEVSTVRVSLDTAGGDTNGDSYHPSISADGRYVAFGSAASDLIDGDTNGFEDIFVRDRDTDNDGIFDEAEAVSTVRVSLTNGGLANGNSYHPDITDGGRFVAFESASMTRTTPMASMTSTCATAIRMSTASSTSRRRCPPPG